MTAEERTPPESLTMMHRFRIRLLTCCGLLLLLPATAPAQQSSSSDDRIIRDLLDTNPSTPSAIARTVKILLDLQHPAEAKPLLKKLIDADLSDDQLLALHAEFGSTFFMRLPIIPELAPEGADFAKKVLETVDHNLRDPQRLAEYISQLSSTKPSERGQAITRLQQGHDAAAAALVGVLADPARENEHHAVQEALLAMRGDAVGPLMTALDSGDAALAVRAITVLGYLDHPDAKLLLYGPAYGKGRPTEVQKAAEQALRRKVDSKADNSPDYAAADLYTLARSYYEQQHPLDVDSQNRAPAWRWDAAQKQPVLEALPAEVASPRWASYWATQARSILPERPEIRRVQLGAVLEEAAARQAANLATAENFQNLVKAMEAEGVDVAEDLLVDAVASGHPIVAAAAAQMLGASGKQQLLEGPGGRPSALVQAARNPDRRVRFAAVGAIMHLQPTQSYPGSSYVTEALEYFVSGSGAPQAIVGDPRTDMAQRLAGLLAGVGYEAQIATDPNTLMELAIASPDCELVLVDLLMAAPTSGELLTRLARDSRTAKLPVGVIAEGSTLDAAQELLLRHRNAEAFVRPMNDDGMKYVAVQLLEHAGKNYVSPAERVAQAKQALTWIAELAAAKEQPYNLHRLEPVVERALWVPDLSIPAADVLATFGASSAQRALAQLANRATQPLAQRQAAANALVRSIRQFGTLLTAGEVLAQYERYNASEQEAPESQALLASILDSMEARATAVKAESASTPR